MLSASCANVYSFDIYIYSSNKDKSYFEAKGASRSEIIYEQFFYTDKVVRSGPISRNSLDKVINKIRHSKSNIIQIDIEAWHSWQGLGVNVSQEIIDRYFNLITEIKSKVPDKKFGYYDTAPTWAHWNITSNAIWRTAWYVENRRRQKIADAADILYPCIYTYHDNYEDWEARAELVMKEAHRMAKGKPVVPFLWPRFHQSTINKSNAVKYIPREYWEKQLAYVRKHADGVVIWNDDEYNEWDDNSDWWIPVQQLLKAKKDSAPNPPTMRTSKKYPTT